MAKNEDTQTVTSNFNKRGTKVANTVLKDVQRLVNKDKGFNAYPGQPYTEMSPQTLAALQQMEGLASQPNQFYQPAADFTTGMLSGQYNHDTSGYQNLYGQNPNAVGKYATGIASGAQGITAGNELDALLAQGAPNAAQQYAGGIASGAQKARSLDQYGRPIASGQEKISTEDEYRDLMSRIDPGFDAVVRQVQDDVGDQIQRQFGGASYGSGSNSDYLTKGISDVGNAMRSQRFYDNLNFAKSTLGDITGVQGQNIANKLAAAGAMSGEEIANIANQLSAAGLISQEQLDGMQTQANIIAQKGSFQNANIQNQLSAAGMLGAEQQQGFTNNMGVLGSIAGLNQTSLQNRANAAAAAPGVYGSQFLPAQQMAQVGGAYDQQQQNQLQALMDQWNIRQQGPWNRAQAATGMLTGAGAAGATQTTTMPTNPLGNILGAGVLGAQLIAGR